MRSREPEQPISPDQVTRLIDAANALLDSDAPPPFVLVTDLIDALGRLQPRDLVRFDEQARSYLSGIRWSRLPRLRGEHPEDEPTSMWSRITRRAPQRQGPDDASIELWMALGLFAADGHERERAIRATQLHPLAVRLLVLRCVDWVSEVRHAALDRLDECGPDLLVRALPLAEQLAAERARGEILSAFLDARLGDEDLRQAYRIDDPRTRRAAWHRLRARGAATAEELVDVAARDPDIVVRGIAATALKELSEGDRRALAEVLIADRIGAVAAPALAALVELDGAPPIRSALFARSPALRRAARDWAAIRGVDARDAYLGRLADDPRDEMALIALAEIRDPADVDLFRQMLVDGRSRVRAAGLRALAHVDRPGGRRAAVEALRAGVTGRVAWAAADVLRDGSPSATEVAVIASVARDTRRTIGQRLSAISLLRPARWEHLAALLEARAAADDEGLARRLDGEIRTWLATSGRHAHGPNAELRARIEALIAPLDAQSRREIEFVLRTSS